MGQVKKGEREREKKVPELWAGTPRQCPHTGSDCCAESQLHKASQPHPHPHLLPQREVSGFVISNHQSSRSGAQPRGQMNKKSWEELDPSPVVQPLRASGACSVVTEACARLSAETLGPSPRCPALCRDPGSQPAASCLSLPPAPPASQLPSHLHDGFHVTCPLFGMFSVICIFLADPDGYRVCQVVHRCQLTGEGLAQR